jgi:hypothetical protein
LLAKLANDCLLSDIGVPNCFLLASSLVSVLNLPLGFLSVSLQSNSD